MKESVGIYTAGQVHFQTLLPQSRPGEAARGRPLDSRRPCRVMVVDDDDLVRSRLTALLKASQYETEVAASGEEALAIMSTNPCHIVLTDWQMPDMDGLSLCRHLRSSDEDAYVYVLMLSVRATMEDRMAGLAAGADDYVIKGASVEELFARLEVGRRITHSERCSRSDNRPHHRRRAADPTEGAHDLRYFVKQMSRELARALRYRHPLAVLSCTMEELENIRQRHGAEAADEVLRSFVTRTESCIRTSSDWLARVGDAEFMIVLPETPATGAHRVAHKLLQTLSMAVEQTDLQPVHFTTSIAVTAVEAKDEVENCSKIEELIRAAQRRPYVRDYTRDYTAADSPTSESQARWDAFKARHGGGFRYN